MLHEDWLHHLVDADLLHATSPAQVVESVTQSLRIRDALGTTGAWLVPDVTEAGSPQLARAGALIVLAMPGAVYLRQGTELGMPVKTSSERAPERLAEADRLREEQRGVSGSSYELFRAALRLRADHRLGLSPLAWVEDIAGPVPEHVLAFLSGEMLVVTNLGTEEFALPPEVEVLLSSGPLSSGSGGVQVLPPDTTAWLWLEPQEPQRDPRARRCPPAPPRAEFPADPFRQGGSSALDGAGGEAADDVALEEEEDQHDRDRPDGRPGGEQAPVGRQLVRDPAVQPHRQRPVRLGLEDELGQEEVGEAGDEGQQGDDGQDRHDEPQDDRPVDLRVGGAVDLRRLVQLLGHGVEEAVHEAWVHAQGATGVNQEETATGSQQDARH